MKDILYFLYEYYKERVINAFSYAYDMNGLRYKKIVNGNETEYYLDGSTIIAENRKVGATNNLIYYIYDTLGLSGMVYNGENYYYIKNTLGDIVGIRNSSGTQVATYYYDAWGNIIAKSGSMADINPFRYRGYYYDNETGFYYLQTRYYDPTICRFINADNYELLGTLAQTVGQLNLYSYCANNPIMYTDETGEFIFTLVIAFAIGATFSAGFSIVSQFITTGSVNWGNVGIAALFGGFGGLLAVTGIGGIWGQFFIQGTLSVGQTLLEAAIYGTWDELTIESIILEFTLSGALGMIGAKGAAREFKRVLQIEDSLMKVLKRDFAKNGLKGLVKTWKNKSSKYVTEFVKKTVKDEFFANVRSSLADIIVVG